MNYLITGGSGFIGQAFINTLTNNESVIVLSRQSKNNTNNELKRYTVIDSLDKIDENEVIDCIINLTGKSIDCIWTNKAKQELIDSRVNTTKSIIKLIKRLKQKPKILISASAIGYYGSHNNMTLDENSTSKKSFTNELCQKWEDEANLANDFNIRTCITRFGVVLGKNKGFIKKTYIPFKLGIGGKIGSGKQLFSWVHIDDVISSIHYLINNNTCYGAYNIVAPQTITNLELTKTMGKNLKRPTIFPIPELIVKTIFGQMGQELLLKGNNIVPKRIVEAGFIFKYRDINQALKEIYKN